MPSMASITVKRQDGTTNVVYNALASSAGDNTPAVWRQDDGQPSDVPVGLRPYFQVWTKWNAARTARQTRFNYVYPFVYTDASTGLFSSKDRVVFSNDAVTLPQGITSYVLREATTEFANLLASDLIKDVMATGYAPT